MTVQRDRFVRLAEARTNKLLKNFDLLGNLSNRSNYAYEEEDVRKIFSVLKRKLKDIETRFAVKGAKKANEAFKL